MQEDILNTKSESHFNLQETINIWLDKIKIVHSDTEVDIEELRSHLPDLIGDLKLKGLDDEEAFLVALKRLKINDNVTTEHPLKNNNILQMRRSLIILGGVLAFFLVFYIIKAISKALLIAVFYMGSSNGAIAVNWYDRILIGWHFIFLAFLTSIFLLEERTVNFIEKIRIRPKYALFMLISAGFFELTDWCFNPVVKSILRYDLYLRDRFLHSSIYFDLSFPMLICIGFIFIYYKYYKKTKI